MSEIIEFSVPSDNDGYVSFQCPHCNELFKLSTSEVQEDDVIILYCPKCGLSDEPSSFTSNDVIEHANVLVENLFNEMINDFSKSLEKGFKNNKNFSFKSGKPLPIEHPNPLYEKDSDFEEFEMSCCNRHIKLKKSGSLGYIYCPYCGV